MLELLSIASGSSGNCICVGTDQTHVLIDAGISGKRIETGLNAFGYTGADMDGILITHEHSDHVQSLGVMARRLKVPIYATPGTIAAIRSMKNLGKMDETLFHPIHRGEDFTIGDLDFHAIGISHDAADPVAYRFTNQKHTMAVMTDLGNYDEEIVASLQGLSGLLLESNHDVRMLQTGPYPYPLKQRILSNHGHLSNERSGQLLCKLLHDDFGSVLLGHLSKENNYEELAYETVCTEVTCGDNPYKACDFEIGVARSDEISPAIRVN